MFRSIDAAEYNIKMQIHSFEAWITTETIAQLFHITFMQFDLSGPIHLAIAYA